MKKSQRILIKFIIFILIILCLYIARGDIMILINRVYPSFNNNKVENFVSKVKDKMETELKARVDLPGALRVVDNLLPKKEEIKLSKNKIIEITNNYRKDNGDLPALKENKYLNLSAEKKLQDMFNKQYFEHISPLGKGVGDISEEVGYQYILIGENLAMGNFDDDAALMDAWMKSKGHRANILNKHYLEIGVAVAKGKFEGKDIWMAVSHFGTPRSNCPSIDEELSKTIALEQSQLQVMEESLLKKQELLNSGVFDEGSSHRVQIEVYNDSLDSYNNLVQKIEEEIIIYNKQVESFNTCISNYQ